MRPLTVLWALRIFGPINSRGLIRWTSLRLETVVIDMMVHMEEGHAVELRPGVWDITDAGRKQLEPKPAQAPAATKPLRRRDWRLRWRKARR